MFDSSVQEESEVFEIAATAIAYARSEDLAEFDNDDLTAQYERLRSAIDQLEAQAARRLAEIDRRKAFAHDGYTSTVAYLKHRCRTTGGRAMRQVGDARSLSAMRRTRELAEWGRLTSDQVRCLIAAKQAQPEHFDVAEPTLCDVALNLEWLGDLFRATQYWQQAVEGPENGHSTADHQARSYLFVSRTFEGMVKLDGLFDAERGEHIIEAVRAATPIPIEGECRAPSNRRADALFELVTTTGSESAKPTLLVHVDVASVTGRTHRLAEMGQSVLTGGQIERLACDAWVRRVVFGPNSEVVDVGRARRLVTGPMREGLIARDRHCRFPGCDRPPQWCDAHHIEPWGFDGITAIANSILVCRHHHTMIHEHGFSVDGVGHQAVFRRPDHTILGSLGSSWRQPLEPALSGIA